MSLFDGINDEDFVNLVAAGSDNPLETYMLAEVLGFGQPFSGLNPQYDISGYMGGVGNFGNLNVGNIDGLNPKLAGALPNIMAELQAKGWQPKIASALRTPAEQAEKVRLGYSQTMNSKHLHGKAVDIVDERYGWDGPASNTNHPFWQDLGAAAIRNGLQWGGNWKNFKDVAHIQTTLNQLNQQQQQQRPYEQQYSLLA